MKSRAMLIGGIGAGKTTLTLALVGKEVKPLKTQSLIYYDWVVDTPGEYTENPMYYRSIMATALEVTHVLFIQDATKNKSIFPPGFSTGINKHTIGVVTKCDHENADVDRAVGYLKKALVSGPIVYTSAFKREGIQELKDLLALSSMKEIIELTSTLENAILV